MFTQIQRFVCQRVAAEKPAAFTSVSSACEQSRATAAQQENGFGTLAPDLDLNLENKIGVWSEWMHCTVDKLQQVYTIRKITQVK